MNQMKLIWMGVTVRLVIYINLICKIIKFFGINRSPQEVIDSCKSTGIPLFATLLRPSVSTLIISSTPLRNSSSKPK